MKTNRYARRLVVIAHVASVMAVLALVSAALLTACHLGRDWGQIETQPAVPVPAMGDWFAAK